MTRPSRAEAFSLGQALRLVTGSGLAEVLGLAFWIAFSLHLAAAEAWIRWTATERSSNGTAARRSSTDAVPRRSGVGETTVAR